MSTSYSLPSGIVVVADPDGSTKIYIAGTLAVTGAITATGGVAGPVSGAVTATTITLTNSSKILDGSADPESSVTAAPGSLYLRTNGKLYKKKTGSSNTGWVEMAEVP